MLLYHFTAREHLSAILEEGLTTGDVPLSRTFVVNGDGVNAVWFTTSKDPSGHGLGSAGLLTAKELRLMNAQPGSRWPDKRAVRITVKMPKSRLTHWVKWARKRTDPALYDGLVKTGGGKKIAETWFMSFDPIPPSEFECVEVRGDGEWLDFYAMLQACVETNTTIRI